MRCETHNVTECYVIMSDPKVGHLEHLGHVGHVGHL